MNTIQKLFAFVIALSFLVVKGVGAQPDEGQTTTILAQTLVRQCAGIHEGDKVLITGGVRDILLLEDIAVQTRSLGAFPIISIASDRLTLRTYENTATRYLSQTPEFDLKLAETINAQISVDYGETSGLLANVPPEQIQAVGKSYQTVSQVLMKRNVRQVNVGNGLYPTPTLAAEFNMTFDDLTRTFWNGVNIDYAKLQTRGQQIQKIFATGRDVRITNSNGTDFTVRISGRQVHVSDGVISEEDIRTGGAACQVWLPAGEVYLSVVPGSAEGKIVTDLMFYQGKEVRGLTMTFKGGKVTTMTALAGIDPIKRAYDIAESGKDEFAFIDVGINPNVHTMPGTKMRTWVSSGMVSIGIGNNTWAGGTNSTPFSLACFIPGSTLKVDNTVIVDNGNLTAGTPLAEIPITTTSKDALQQFTTGRELVEQLRTREAINHLDKAIASDPDFGTAYVYRAMCEPNGSQTFIENLNKAVLLSEKVSPGERIMIQAEQEGFNGNSKRQEELLREVVTKYPDDVRARMQLAVALQNRQDIDGAIRECNAVVRINPRYAPAYNTLGYLHSYTENYFAAEKAFKTYANLIPGEPNPYDSYAELLMKEGNFDESITMYQKALSIDPKFYSAIIGISTNYALKGMTTEARKHLQKMLDTAPDNGVRRQALTGMVVVSLIEGKFDRAISEVKDRHAIAVKDKNTLAIARDLGTMGEIQLVSSMVDMTKGTFLKTRTPETALVQEAGRNFSQALATIQNSNLNQDIKDVAQRGDLYNQTIVAIHSNDISTARSKADQYRTQTASRNDPVRIQRAHYLSGLVALSEKRHNDALIEFNQADLKNPRTLLQLANVYDAMGNTVKAKELKHQVVNFNESSLNFALVRWIAQK